MRYHGTSTFSSPSRIVKSFDCFVMHENWWWCRQRHPVNCAISSLIIYEEARATEYANHEHGSSKQKKKTNKQSHHGGAHTYTYNEDLLKNRINFEQVLNSLLIQRVCAYSRICVYEFVQFMCFGSVVAYYCLCAIFFTSSSFCSPLSSFFMSLSFSVWFASLFSAQIFSAGKKTENKLKSLCRMEKCVVVGRRTWKKFHSLIILLRWNERLCGF